MDVFTIKFRRGTQAEWFFKNPTLKDGEPGFELDTKKLKIGDGATSWNDLPYFLSEDGISGYIDQVVSELEIGEPEVSDLVLLWANAKA